MSLFSDKPVLTPDQNQGEREEAILLELRKIALYLAILTDTILDDTDVKEEI